MVCGISSRRLALVALVTLMFLRGLEPLRHMPISSSAIRRLNLPRSSASGGQSSHASGRGRVPSISQRAPTTELGGSASACPTVTLVPDDLSSGRAPTVHLEDLSTGRAPTTQLEDLSTRRAATTQLEDLSSGRAPTAHLGSSSSTIGQASQRGGNRRRAIFDSSLSHPVGSPEFNPSPSQPIAIMVSSDEEEVQSRRQDKRVMEEIHHVGEPSIFEYHREESSSSHPHQGESFINHFYQGESSTPHFYQGESSTPRQRAFSYLFGPTPS